MFSIASLIISTAPFVDVYSLFSQELYHNPHLSLRATEGSVAIFLL
jgi:hypothetical protein